MGFVVDKLALTKECSYDFEFPLSVSFHQCSTLSYSSITDSIGNGSKILKFIVMILHTYVHMYIFFNLLKPNDIYMS